MSPGFLPERDSKPDTVDEIEMLAKEQPSKGKTNAGAEDGDGVAIPEAS